MMASMNAIGRTLLPLLLLQLCSCASKGTRGDYTAEHRAALAATEARKRPASPEAVARFKDFYADFSEAGIKAKIGGLYAEDVWFHDTLKQVTGRQALEAYMIHGAQATERTTVESLDVVEKDGDYYFRWEMTIRFKSLAKGQDTKSVGISLVRFDETGRVIFHQDFWDSASAFYEKVPVVGGMIRWIKGKL